jgi:hypothetical protein
MPGATRLRAENCVQRRRPCPAINLDDQKAYHISNHTAVSVEQQDSQPSLTVSGAIARVDRIIPAGTEGQERGPQLACEMCLHSHEFRKGAYGVYEE